MTIHGHMAESEKRDRIEKAKSKLYDALLFTASMDAGVSIEVEGYGKCHVRLNNRSINANAVIQMVQRVRKYIENQVDIVCASPVKDWVEWTGYHVEKIKDGNSSPTGTRTIIDERLQTVHSAKKYLFRTHAVGKAYVWVHPKARYGTYVFRRNTPPANFCSTTRGVSCFTQRNFTRC